MLIDRRFFLGGSAALGTLAFGAPGVLGQAKPRVVVIGGGPGGATAAKYIAKDSAGAIEVVLVEPAKQFITCFHSNPVSSATTATVAVTSCRNAADSDAAASAPMAAASRVLLTPARGGLHMTAIPTTGCGAKGTPLFMLRYDALWYLGQEESLKRCARYPGTLNNHTRFDNQWGQPMGAFSRELDQPAPHCDRRKTLGLLDFSKLS